MPGFSTTLSGSAANPLAAPNAVTAAAAKPPLNDDSALRILEGNLGFL